MRKPIVRHTLLWVLGGIAMDRQVRYWCTRRYSENEMVDYSIYNSTKTNSEGVRAMECPICVFWLSSCQWPLLQTSQFYLEAHAFPRALISVCPPFNKWPLVHPSHISSSLMTSGSQPALRSLPRSEPLLSPSDVFLGVLITAVIIKLSWNR